MKTNSRQDSPSSRAVESSSQLEGLGLSGWNWDLESNKVTYSREWKQLRGLDEIEIRNTPDESLTRVHPEDLEGLKRRRTKLVDDSSGYYEFDHRVRHENGNWIWISERARAVRDKTGKVVRLIGCDIEITDRKQEELNLREQNEKQKLLSSIVEAATDFIGIANAQRKILYHNRSARNKNPKLNAENRPDFLNSHPEWVQKILLDEAIPAVIKNGSWEGEVSVLGSEGQEIPVSQVLLGHKGDDGELSFFSTIIRDISERKKIELALLESERMFSSLAAAAPASVFRFSDGSNCVYVNQRWGELTGRPLEEALGQKWMKCVHPDDLTVVQGNIQALIEDDTRTVDEPREVRIVLPDGSEKRILLHIAKERDEFRNVTGLVGTLTDIERTRTTEENLQRLHQRLQAVLKCSSIGIWEYLFEDERLTWDDQMLKIYGVDAGNFRGVYDDWSDRLHPDDFDRMMSRDNCRGELEGSSDDNFRIVRPNGEVRHIYANVSVERNEQGEPTRTTGINMDITDRRVAELALSQSQDKFKRIVEGVAEVIWSADCKGALTYLSPRFESMFGLNAADWIGKTPFNLMHPDDRCDLEPSVKEQLKEGSTRKNEEFRHLCADGSYLWVALTAAPVMDEKGCTTGFHGVMRDISQRKTAELALRESDQRFASLAATTQAGIFRMNNENECVFVNERWGELTGRPIEEALGQGWMSSVHPDDFEWMQEETRAFIADDTLNVDQPKEVRHVLPDGSPSRVLLHLAKERDEHGTVTGLVGTLTDIETTRAAEVALLESETKFQRVVEQVPGVVFRFKMRPDGTDELLYVNSRIRDVFELEPQEAIEDSSKIWGTMHRDDVERVAAEAAEAAKSSDSLKQEYRLELPKKGVRWVQVTSHRTLEDNGDVIWDGILIDQTDRKMAELALQESETKFQRVADHAPGMFFRYIVHPDGKDEMAYVNSGVLDIFGVEPEDAMGGGVNKVWARIQDDDREDLAKAVAVSAEKLTPLVAEYRLNFPDGFRYAQTYAQPFRTEDGDIVWDGVVLDHTKQKVAQLALQESQSQYQRMTENVPGMIWRMTLTEDGYAVTYLSSKSREMFEVEPEEVLEDSEALRKYIHPDDIESYLASQKSAIENEESFSLEYCVILPEQGLRWRQCIASPSTTESGDVVWDGMAIDITERKEIELENDVLAKATKTKDEFLANMSHELRTPLTAILAMTDGLQLGIFGEITAKQKDSLAIVEQSGMHLLDLINELLDIAKIESGQTKLTLSSVNVDDLCKTSLQLVTQQAKKKDIQTILNVPQNLPNFEGDKKRLRQVLLNLLSNAIKFTGAGGKITLAVQRLRRDANDGSNEILRVTVSDTGIGIHADQMESLFDPFVQVDSSLSRSYEGTGLGLSLVKQFVLLHSGTVSVESEPGVGSCFTIDIPFRELPNQDTAAPDDSTTSHEKSNSTEQGNSKLLNAENKSTAVILLAEDNDNVADALTPILKMSDFHVLRAENGKVAFEIACQKHPDIILMDVQMPLMDGLETIRKIRQMPDLAETPIIALSGFAMPEESSRCKDAGADLFISKPCMMNELLEKIHSLLEQKPKRKQA